MAILLEFNYGKKLGLPGYSSHNFGVSMKAEVNDPEAIPQEAERVYSILQQSVDSQIANPGFIPSGNGKAIQVQPNGNESKTDPDKWNCTVRQRGLLMTILERNDLDPEVVEDLSQELHGRPMSDLGKAQVSEVIGEVLDRWGRHPKTNGRTAGGRQ
jgi:hypothetical protein